MYWFRTESTLSSYTIPDDVVSMTDAIMLFCNIQHLKIGKSLKKFGPSRFTYKTLEIDENNPYLYTTNGYDIVSQDGILYHHAAVTIDSYTTPSGVYKIRRFCFFSSVIKNLTISSVTTLEDYSLHSSSGFTNLTIPSSVTSMSTNILAFAKDLTNLTINGGGSTTPINLIYNCANLTTVTIGYNLTKISSNLILQYPKLKSLNFTQTTPPTTISSSCISNCGSSYKIYVPDNSISAYKSKMSSFASKIYGVSSLG